MLSFTEFLAESATEGTAIQTREYDIPTHNLAYVTAHITKLNKVAAKLNVRPVTLETVGQPTFKDITLPATADHRDRKVKMEFVKIKLTGEAPKLDGWTFVGKREPLEGTKSVLTKSAPGMEMPAKYMRDTMMTCDHCGRSKNRASTFIVKKGRAHKEVGRMCLKDFLGHNDPGKYADFATSLADLESMLGHQALDYSGYGSGRGAEYTFDTHEVVAVMIRSIKDSGFTSKQASLDRGVNTTAGRVYEHFDTPPLPPKSQYSRAQWLEMHTVKVTDADRHQATEAIKWVKDHPNARRDEFWRNASIMIGSPATGRKAMSYIAAAINMYIKEKGSEQSRKAMSAGITDKYAGEEGEKVTLVGTVVGAFSYNTPFGAKRVITVRTVDNTLVKMFTMSGDAGIKQNDEVQITGSIGKNEVESYDRSPFKGKKMSTMAPRARIRIIKSA